MNANRGCSTESPARCLVVAVVAVLWVLVPACSKDTKDNNDDNDAGETDTDTLMFDGGPLVPCENEPGPDEICIQGGSFPMGCVPQDDGCLDEEKPLHTVTLSPFFIDRHEATYEDVIPWLNTLREGYVRNPYFVTTEDGKNVWSNGNRMPIVLNGAGDYELCPDNINCDDVDWPGWVDEEFVVGAFSHYGAELYCSAQGKQLPTEAQWEYAARGPTYYRFPGQDEDWGCSMGFIAKCEDQTCYPGGSTWCIPQGVEVGVQSVFGVMNMLGSAAEWVADTLPTTDEDYSWCADGCTNPVREGIYPITKGGGSCTSLNDGRISDRPIINGDIYTLAMHCAGVRCARPDEPFVQPDGGTDGGF